MRLQPQFKTKKREDGGVAFVMLAHLHRDARLKEKNAFMGLVALLSTTQEVSAAWLGREIGVHPDTAADILKVLIKAGYLIRATVRKGQRNDCQYLVLGQPLERTETGALDMEDSWTAAAVEQARGAWPRAMRFDPALPEVVSGGSSDPADVTRLSSPGSAHPAETTPAIEEVSGAGSGTGSGPGRAVAVAPSTPRGRRSAAAKSTRKGGVHASVAIPEEQLARTALAHYTRQVDLANSLDGKERWKPTQKLLPLLGQHAARHTTTDLRDALDYAVFGDGTSTGPALERTASLDALAGWLHKHMADKQPYTDEEDMDRFLAECGWRAEHRLPSYDEAPPFRELPVS